MLSRWKSYYGYKKRDDEVIECLDLAWREVMGNVSPQLLNQKLQGSLQENRYIAKKFYEVMRNIHKEQRNHFVKTKLKVSDTEIASIMADYSNDVDEQCFQMFMTWKRKSMLQRYAEISNEIEKLLDEFLDRNGGPNEARGGPERHQQVSSDTGRGGRSFQHNELHQQPSGPG
ncbi:uncharacterized protein LOC120328277 isoform X2 [Styela clava]|nr:uncharacterized protein LOC120328277 isoform X2 [Styela clava]